jgi:hypothetical protein
MRNFCSLSIALALAACAGAPLEPDSSTDDASPVSDAAVDSRAILEAGNDTVEASVDAGVIVPDAEASVGDSSVDAEVSTIEDATADVSREATTADAFSACSVPTNGVLYMSRDYYTSIPMDPRVMDRLNSVGMRTDCVVIRARITQRGTCVSRPMQPNCNVSITRDMITTCAGRYVLRIPAGSCTDLCVSPPPQIIDGAVILDGTNNMRLGIPTSSVPLNCPVVHPFNDDPSFTIINAEGYSFATYP